MTTTKEQRQRYVEQTNARMRPSGFEPDADMLALQQRYIEGEITIQDMLDWGAALGRLFQRREGQAIPVPRDAH
jgi:hypothetical protein